MELHTKIVEFVGPAACGKSTLCNLYRDRFAEKKRTVACWKELTSSFKELGFAKKIRCISLLRMLAYLKMYWLAKPEKQWRLYLFLYFVKIDILYTFARKFSNYDFVFVEHGILQNVISTQNQVILSQEDVFLSKVASLLNRLNYVDVCVYCDLNVDEALSRMAKRNRIDEGRIDKEKNIDKKRQMLQRDSENCATLFGFLENRVNGWSSKHLNAQRSVEELYQELLPLFVDKE